MEVHITSRQMVKPLSKEVYLRKPFSLSLLDQLIPAHYSSVVLFYNKPNDSDFNTTQLLARLKKSLSETLNQFYPLSGRTINNHYIDSFDKGVPYVEAMVKGCLADCLSQTKLEWLNQLLPSQSYCIIPTSTSPQLSVQVNLFDCGGIAISICGSHKIMETSTTSAFLNSWAAFNRGVNGQIPNPDMLDAGSRLFPPMESVPQNILSLMERHWFQEGWYTTRRFVFDDHAIATLKLKAKSERLEHPTGAVTLAAFLWKSAMLASREAWGRSKPSILTQAMNLRPRIKPGSLEHAIGNLIWSAILTYNPAKRDIELHELAYMVREAMEIANDVISLRESGDVLKFLTDQYNQVMDIGQHDDVEFIDCSSWFNFLDGGRADFGWGQPSSWRLGRSETRYNMFRRAFVLNKIGKGKDIEAVITLDARTMDILEHHSGFLAFASSVSSPYPNKSKV